MVGLGAPGSRRAVLRCQAGFWRSQEGGAVASGVFPLQDEAVRREPHAVRQSSIMVYMRELDQAVFSFFDRVSDSAWQATMAAAFR